MLARVGRTRVMPHWLLTLMNYISICIPLCEFYIRYS